MSPNAARLFFASSLSLLAGVVLGIWATRAVFGEPSEQVAAPVTREKTCPPCEKCRECPPPVDCAAGTAPTSTVTHALLTPESDEPEQRHAGLPASAIQVATTQIRKNAEPCLEEAIRVDARGTILLDLTVTSTGGQGFISDANVAARSADARATGTIETCVVESAKKTRFDLGTDDGEAHFRLPMKLRKEP